MKEQLSIPTSKVQRASKFLSTGAKVGGNYVKHYSKKLFNSDLSKDELDANNAEDIYNSLSQLKGSALKVAQMLSMDKNVLPGPFQEKFALSQYSAPPLSYPLVVKTFQKYFGKSPDELFDSFSKQAINAASIGQVHQASLNGKKLAVKIQYPGVADSISSDLRIVKPIASRMFNVGNAELNEFMGEVEEKLIEETDYKLELERSMKLSKSSQHLPNIIFPEYYPELSSDRILVMDWVDGIHLKDWIASNPDEELRNRIGQALWTFYDYQIHELKELHADPHPGNFLITPDNKLAILDFGCVKEIPESFYKDYFQLMDKNFLNANVNQEDLFLRLGMLSKNDSREERDFFKSIFMEMVELLGRPFRSDVFDFGDNEYFEQIYKAGDRISKLKEVRKSKSARGSKDALYINRTYFGMYNILNMLEAKVATESTALTA